MSETTTSISTSPPPLPQLTLYTRPTSNNSGRITLFLNILPSHPVTLVNVTHASQKTSIENNPKGKIPFLKIQTPTSTSTLTESSIILSYLLILLSPPLPSSNPLITSKIREITQTHDIYISSPSSSFSSPNTYFLNVHCQGCMYIPPPGNGGRGIPWELRMIKLSDLFEGWLNIARLIEGNGGNEGNEEGYAVGGKVTEADYTIFPSLCYLEYYLPLVFDIAFDKFCSEERDILLKVFKNLMKIKVFEEYRNFLRSSLECERIREFVKLIKEDGEKNGGVILPDRG